MKRIGIIGAGRFGFSLVESLAHRGAEILLLDKDQELIQRVSGIVANAIQGHAEDRDTLLRAGFQECDVAVVAIGSNVGSSVMATVSLKDIGVPYVIANASSDAHGNVLRKLGADVVINPNKERANRLARSMMTRAALDYYEVVQDASIIRLKAPSEFIGKTLAEAGVRKAYGITVLAITRAINSEGKEDVVINPKADDVIKADDTLVVFGPNLLLEAISS
jgi:trk system potassium uptake protein TrkA